MKETLLNCLPGCWRELLCSGAFNIIYIMRIRIAEGEKQPPSVNQSYNQRPDLADAMSIPIVNSGT
ncbi:hypothetical protein HU22_00530 [Salmonella enterica]|nr:hypothetical protein [Salmonella enterica]